jgi:hypothetical protein
MSRAVIKAGEGKIVSQGYCSLDLRDISAQAESMISGARIEAARIIAEAKAECAVLRQREAEAGREEGYREGLAKGEQEGGAKALAAARERFGQEHASLISTLTNLTQQFTAKRERLYLEARQDAVLLGHRHCRADLQHARCRGAFPAGDEPCLSGSIGDSFGSDATRHPERPADAAAVERFCGDLNQSGEIVAARANRGRRRSRARRRYCRIGRIERRRHHQLADRADCRQNSSPAARRMKKRSIQS